MKKIVTVLIAIAALFGAVGPQKAKAAGGDMAVEIGRASCRERVSF